MSDLAHPAKRKPSIKGDEARSAYIDATIDLLREIPISEITTRKIAERAAIDRSVITRHFGTIDKVFLEVCKELIFRTSKRMLTQPQVNEAVDVMGYGALQGSWGHRLLGAQSNTIAGGTTNIYKSILAEHSLGLPR